jgi:hypothetical protein
MHVFSERVVPVDKPVEDVRRMITYHLKDVGTPVFISEMYPKVYYTAYIKRSHEPWWTRTLIQIGHNQYGDITIRTEQPDAKERWSFELSVDAFYDMNVHDIDNNGHIYKFSRVRPPVSVDQIIELGLQANFGIFANGPLAARLGSFMGSAPGTDSKAIDIEDSDARQRRVDERIDQLTRQIDNRKRQYEKNKSPELLEQIVALENEASDLIGQSDQSGQSKRRRLQTLKYGGKGIRQKGRKKIIITNTTS